MFVRKKNLTLTHFDIIYKLIIGVSVYTAPNSYYHLFNIFSPDKEQHDLLADNYISTLKKRNCEVLKT